MATEGVFGESTNAYPLVVGITLSLVVLSALLVVKLNIRRKT